MSKGWGLGLLAGAALALPGAALHAGFQSGFDVRFTAGGNYNSGADLESDNGFPVDGSFAIYGDLGADYGNAAGFVLGLDLLNGPNRSHPFRDVAGANTYTGTISVANLGLFLAPGWRVRLADRVVLEARLGLGAIAAKESFETDGFGTATATGYGYGVWPEFRGEYELGSWGLGLSVGYLASLVPALEDSNGQVVQNTQATYATLRTEGFSTGLSVAYHFSPLLN
jgi:hypothetical protein